MSKLHIAFQNQIKPNIKYNMMSNQNHLNSKYTFSMGNDMEDLHIALKIRNISNLKCIFFKGNGLGELHVATSPHCDHDWHLQMRENCDLVTPVVSYFYCLCFCYCYCDHHWHLQMRENWDLVRPVIPVVIFMPVVFVIAHVFIIVTVITIDICKCEKTEIW